jgi:hypothetical protein
VKKVLEHDTMARRSVTSSIKDSLVVTSWRQLRWPGNALNR